MRTTTTCLAAVLTVLVSACGGGGSSPTGPSTPPAQIPQVAGTWTITLVASTACSLPAAARERLYTARVTQSGAEVAINLIGNFSVNQSTGVARPGGVDVTFLFTEQLNSTSFLSVYGTGFADLSLSFRPMSGTIHYFDIFYTDRSCIATDHRFIATRRP